MQRGVAGRKGRRAAARAPAELQPLQLHAGRQDVQHHAALSYTDYKLGVSKEFKVATVGLAWVKTNSDAYRAPDGRNLGRSGTVLSLSRTF